MIGTISAFSAMAVAGRAVSLDLDTFEIMLFRSLIGFAIVAMIGLATGQFRSVRTDHLGLHIVRNLAHFSGQNLWFYAITVAPLAQVFALEFTTPIWAILLAPLILQEKITRVGTISALIGFVGILIVARPNLGALSPGLVAAAFSAVGFGLTALFTRRLTRTQSIFQIILFLTIIQAVLGLITAGADLDIALPTRAAWPWIILIATAGLIAHFCLTKALKLAPASIVTPIDFARLPIIALIGMMFYNEAIEIWVFIGGGVIFAANYLNITLRNK